MVDIISKDCYRLSKSLFNRLPDQQRLLNLGCGKILRALYTSDGTPRFILPARIGFVISTEEISPENVRKIIEPILQR